MKRKILSKLVVALATLAVAFSPGSLLACAACYGQSDSRLAVGMNWGILVLMCVVGSVLAGFATAGVYFVKRSAMVAAGTLPEQKPQTIEKI